MSTDIPSILPIALNVIGGGIRQKEDKNQRAQIEAQAAIDEDRRQKALKSAMATQRARFGAAGVDHSTSEQLSSTIQQAPQRCSRRPLPGRSDRQTRGPFTERIGLGEGKMNALRKAE